MNRSPEKKQTHNIQHVITFPHVTLRNTPRVNNNNSNKSYFQCFLDFNSSYFILREGIITFGFNSLDFYCFEVLLNVCGIFLLHCVPLILLHL